MFVAPAVACEISAPPRIPRGTSCSGPGFTSFMRSALPPSSSASSADRKIVVEPLRAPGADPVVQRLRARVVQGGLPVQRRHAAAAAAVGAGGDERLAEARAPGGRHDEEV